MDIPQNQRTEEERLHGTWHTTPGIQGHATSHTILSTFEIATLLVTENMLGFRFSQDRLHRTPGHPATLSLDTDSRNFDPWTTNIFIDLFRPLSPRNLAL